MEKENTGTLDTNQEIIKIKPGSIEKHKKRLQAEKRNQQYRLMQNIERELYPLEEKIHRLDREKGDIEKQLCRKDILQNSEKVRTLMVDLHQINHYLEHLMKQWEILMKKKELL